MARSPLDKIRAMSEEIADLDRVIEQARAELGMLVHIDDDARRDALVSEHEEDRQAARMTAADVARLERQIVKLETHRAKVAAKQKRAIDKIAST
ncbi:MAG: hypothetical protein M5U23_06230 [Acidimicrobiia bacterium]|nr:hypothetical protein [Acidimicrobiia bacterium]